MSCSRRSKRRRGFLQGQRGGRLVEHQHLDVAGQRLDDLDHLLVAHREAADLGAGLEVHLEQVQQLLRPPVHRSLVDQAEGTERLLVGEDVFRHRQVGHQAELLEHHADARLLALMGVVKRNLTAVEEDPARVGSVGAGQDVDQRGLARAVLAHQRQDLPVRHVQRHVGECLDAGEGLRDALDPEQLLLLRHRSLLAQVGLR